MRIPSKIGRKYGYKPGLKDPHARLYALRLPAVNEILPATVDLQPQCPAVYDQGQEGSCTANALAFIFDFQRWQQGLTFMTPSRDFIYAQELLREGSFGQDNGAFGGDGIAALQEIGVPPESVWPYTARGYCTSPTPAAIAAAKDNKVRAAELLNPAENGIYEIKHALFHKRPVAFGMTLFESFESEAVARTGHVPDPVRGEPQLGGHETALVGYDDAQKKFKVRNSWGAGWGQQGYFWVSYKYVLASGGDFRVITEVSSASSPSPLPPPAPPCRRECDYAVNDTVVVSQKWFKKIQAEPEVAEGTAHPLAIWVDDAQNQYEPTLAFSTGLTGPAFLPLPAAAHDYTN